MEMREAEVRDIDGFTYEVRPLATTKGLKLMTMLAQVLGTGVGVVMEGPTGVARAVPSLLDKITDTMLTEVCVMLGERTTVHLGAKKPQLTGEVFEAHFAGRYHALVQWLRFALEVNFGPLVEWLRTAQPDAPKAPEKTAA